MGDLIDSLLNLSRVSRSELAITTVNLSQLAVELSDQWRQAYPDKQATVHIAQGLVVEGDLTLLRLLLQNLLDNAWKFTDGCKQPSIAFGCEEIGGRETYFVRDNGVGFESEYAHKLFLPFERLHESAQYEGIGIGLATVRRIVQRHHGVAWAEGAVGKGATFYFTLAAEAVDRREYPMAVAAR
jgi:light-regulated signal transduction histidine kinase (bacteriophytochrome)